MASVRRHDGWSESRRLPEFQPGELVWANIINGIENSGARGKLRPVILIESKGSAWRTMGLTTNPRYRNGSSRVAIPDPLAVGLKATGWLWGERLAWTAGIDLRDHIGWADEALVFALCELAGLTGQTVRDLVAAARMHHAGAGASTDRVEGTK